MDWIDERPKRKFRAKNPDQKKKLILVTDAAVFAARDKKNQPKQEFSAKIVEQLKESRHADALFFVCLSPAWEIFREPLEASGLNVVIFRLMLDKIGDTMVRLRRELQSNGVKFKPIRNPRTVSHLVIDRFIRDDSCLVVHADGTEYGKLSIQPDKELTFMDKARARKRKSAWV